jgi:predicted phage-related endonuclease
MKIIQCSQGSAEWFDARLGRPTASHFGDIITATGIIRKGATPRRYMIELLAERLTGLPTQHFETAAMERGTELEPVARKWYSFSTGRDVRQVGLITTECERFAGSPDGLCEDRGIEIKCPMVATFCDIAESGKLPDDHFLQVQGLLWLTGLPAWDYVLYTDVRGLVPVVITCTPNSAIHDALETALPMFADQLDAMEKAMREAGHGWKQQKEIADDDQIPGDPFA